MGNKNLSGIFFDELKKMPVIDTHEHLITDESVRANAPGDVLSEYLIHYLSSDIISSGLSREDLGRVRDASGKLSIAERWKIIEPYWEYSRYTGYGRALDIAARDIYGVDGVRRDTVETLNGKFLEAKKAGHYGKVLKNLCGIETSLVDTWSFRDAGDENFFKKVWQPNNFITPHEENWTGTISAGEGVLMKIDTIDNWLEAFQTELDYYLNKYKVRVLKTAAAYYRTLRFEKVGYPEAKSLFEDVIKRCRREKGEAQFWFPHELQDFMMHYALKLANERFLTFQIHTGILEGNGNVLANTDPSLMTNLFLEYPGVSFDLFHISYPFQGTASALAKMFPNVFIDMCWAHIISPAASMSALSDFLDAVPYNKISAFGGDYCFVDGVYGHLYLSRENVSRVLAEKVSSGVFSESKALDIAKAMYYNNPKRIFKLDNA